jgi:hypothetical protein
MKLSSIAAAGAVAACLTLGAVASAQTFINPNAPGYQRGYRSGGGGEAELQRDVTRIAGMIRAIEADRHDDGGYRMRAIGDLERARQELERAIQWDRGHNGR